MVTICQRPHGAAELPSSQGWTEDKTNFRHTSGPGLAARGAAADLAASRRRPRRRGPRWSARRHEGRLRRTTHGARGREEKSQRTSEPLEDARKSPEEPQGGFGRSARGRTTASSRSWQAAGANNLNSAAAASPVADASGKTYSSSPAQLVGADLRISGFDGTLRAACGAILPLSEDDNIATLGRLLAGFEQAEFPASAEARPRDVWKIATCNANAWSSARAALQAVQTNNIDFTMLQELRVDANKQAATAIGQAAADGYRLSLSLAVRTDKDGPLANSGGVGLASPRHISARPLGRQLEQITADLRRQATAEELRTFPTDAWFEAHILWRAVSGILKGDVLLRSFWTIPGMELQAKTCVCI